MIVKIGYTNDGTAGRSWFQYDAATGWRALKSYHHIENKTVEAELRDVSAPLGLLQDVGADDGIASWYAYRGCLCAASRMYPKGTLLNITRLKTGHSVVVRINDYGPEEWTGRTIDLDKTAFQKIGSLGAGLIYVRVEPYTEP